MNDFVKFDDTSIASTEVSSKGKFAIRKRELILAVFALVALVLVIILGVALAVQGSKSPSKCSQQDSQTLQNEKIQGQNVNQCETVECLKAAAYQKPIMKESLDPCQDFYSFACGNYAKEHIQTPELIDVSPKELVYVRNRQMMEVLLKPNSFLGNDGLPSYEIKLKAFLQSCTNHFDKMDLRGLPLIQKMIEPMGGWWVFGDDVLGKFDLQKSTEMAKSTFLVPVFVGFSISANSNNLFENLIEIDDGGNHLNFISQRSLQMPERVQQTYKNYVHQIALMLSYDNHRKVSLSSQESSERARIFSEDVLEVEKALIQLKDFSPLNFYSHDLDQQWTLTELNGHMNGTIDFVSVLKSTFNEYPSKFSGDTKITVNRPEYFKNLGNVLSTYMSDNDGKRKLHNYIIWQVISLYVQDLSFDYVHATSRFRHQVIDDYVDFSTEGYCFEATAHTFFVDAINGFFVNHLVSVGRKEEAKRIVEDIKTTFLQIIQKLPWMSDTDRDYAYRKVKSSLYKIGFPDYLMDHNYLNNKYAFVEIKDDDFFGNVLRLVNAKRKSINEALNKANFRHDWTEMLYKPVLFYDNAWQDFMMTSAILQRSLFSHNGPMYYNYGGVGSDLAAKLVTAIDEIGATYKIGGSHFGSWWSENTEEHYDKIRECAADAWRKSTPGPFPYVKQNGDMINLPVDKLRNDSLWTSLLLSTSSGIRMAFKAYSEKQKTVQEKIPPGFSKYGADQMFFISYAQGNCQNAQPIWKYFNLVYNDEPSSKEMVNLALHQVPEFKKAFNCPTKYREPEPCLLFP